MDGFHQVAEVFGGIVITGCPPQIITHIDSNSRPFLGSMRKGRKKDILQEITTIKSAFLGILMDHAEPPHTILSIESWKVWEDESAQNARFKRRKHVKEELAVVWGWYWVGHLWDVHGDCLVCFEAKSSQRNAPPRYPFVCPAFGIRLFSHEIL